MHLPTKVNYLFVTTYLAIKPDSDSNPTSTQVLQCGHWITDRVP